MVPEEYYFISDLHIGDGQIARTYDAENELIDLLKRLSEEGKKAELIIVGDTFGFWETNGAKGIAKLLVIIKNHQKLFRCFKKAGKKIKITIIPGNHDYELACYPEFIGLLKKYGICLEPKRFIERTIAGKKIRIEHGSQYDDFNYVSNFGDPNATPIGYYVTNKIVGGAHKHAVLGRRRQRWLKDLGSVYPNERIPSWMFSSYFYREMSPIIRYTLLPFFLFFTVSFIILVGLTLEKTKILPTDFSTIRLGDYFPILGDLLDIIIIVDIIVLLLFIAFVIVFSVPFFFIFKDVRKTLKRYEFLGPSNLNAKKEKVCLAAIKQIFKKDSHTAIYVYGHTHAASVRKINKQVVINTGAWTKKLKKISSRFLLLPAVYYPSFQLGYFKIYQQGTKIAIDYQNIFKKIDPDLTLLQRFAILGKKKEDKINIPRQTLIDL